MYFRLEEQTNLECRKSHTLNSVANEEKILDGPQRGHVDSNIQECNAHEALVGVECTHEDLKPVQFTCCKSNGSSPSGP